MIYPLRAQSSKAHCDPVLFEVINWPQIGDVYKPHKQILNLQGKVYMNTDYQ